MVRRREEVTTYLQCRQTLEWEPYSALSIHTVTSRLHYVMNSFVSDDISTYAAWRANIRKYQIYQNLANESLTDLKQRLMSVTA